MRVIATAGHVDHGKSTLVQALTGIDPDRFAEEKRRGLTIDLGFAWLTLPSGLEVGIVDVPGHERFIRNMLAGVGSVDAVLFVVAADEGWMPQSAEHMQILEFLGVERGIVALTKTDIAGELVDEAERDVIDHLEGTPFEDAPIVRVSAKTRDGLSDLVAAMDETLDYERPPETGRTRLFVDRVFTIAGAGAVVTGTLGSGRISVGDEVTILPQGRSARVRSMETHGEHVDVARAPRRLAVNLIGIDHRLVHRGDVVVEEPWLLTGRAVVRLDVSRAIRHALKTKGAYELYVGSAQTACRLRFLADTTELRPGDRALAVVTVTDALPLLPGDRFVLRDVGRWETVAGGTVIDIAPPRRVEDRYLETLTAREALTGAGLAAWLITHERVISYERLGALTGTGPRELSDALDAAAERYEGDLVFARGSIADLAGRITDAIGTFHRENPLAAGMPSASLKKALEMDDAVLEVVVGEMEEHHTVVVDGSVLRLPTHHGAELSVEDRVAADDALRQLRDADTSPPDLTDVGLSQQLARALERKGELVFLTPTIAYPADVWRNIEDRVVGFIADNGRATLAQIRDAVGTTRKYAVPIAEKLDATGITRRRGDLRELGPRAKASTSTENDA